jgi:CubicO group peptidase (beta-lactamase class C family)
MIKPTIRIAAALTVACLTGGAEAQEAVMDAELEAFAAELDSLRTAHSIPGLSVAVVRDGRVVLARGFGLADVERDIPATAETPYNIASVSKTISGVVALRLAERGVLDLDRPMSSFRGWTEFCAGVMEEGPRVFFSDYRCDTEPLTLRHVLSMSANGAVGQHFFYNPISFSWASRPIAEAAGRPFSTLVAEEVFAPAGMTRSARIHRSLPLRPDLAADLAPPYHADSAGKIARSPEPGPQGDGAAGGVVSTVADLARFDIALDEGRLLSEARRAEMWRPGRSSAGEALPYGIGWYAEEVEGRRVVWHSGWWERAYSALYLKLPDERLTLILLANGEGLWWVKPLDKAEVEKSPFAAAFLRRFDGPARP